MQISKSMQAKVYNAYLTSLIASDWDNLSKLADEMKDKPLPVICSHCKKEITDPEEKKYVEEFGVCLNCEKVISDTQGL